MKTDPELIAIFRREEAAYKELARSQRPEFQSIDVHAAENLAAIRELRHVSDLKSWGQKFGFSRHARKMGLQDRALREKYGDPTYSVVENPEAVYSKPSKNI